MSSIKGIALIRGLIITILLWHVPLLAASKELSGLIFTPPREAPSRTQCEISIQGLEIPDEDRFLEEMVCFLGAPLTQELIQEIQTTVLQFYQQHGLFLAKVSLPPKQEVSAGVVHFVIAEGVLGDVYVNEPRWFSESNIRSTFRVEEGQPLYWNRLRSDLDWINQNPFHQTTLLFEPSSRGDRIDMRLVTEDRFPLRVYGGYENNRNLIAGNSRYFSGAQWGNVFGLDHQLTCLFLTAGDFSDWWGTVATYIAPLSWRHRFEVFGAYVHSELSNQNGWGAQGTGRYVIPFWTGDIKHEAGFGYAFKRSNNTFEFGENIQRMFDISQFLLFYGLTLDTSVGKTECSLSLQISPGNMTPFNTDSDFQAIRAGADSNYVYGQFELDQIFFLPKNFSWVTNMLFQQSTGPLLPSEEFFLGGYTTIRGYPEYEVLSDNGILLKNECRLPSWSIRSWRQIPHELQVLLFVDIGWAYDVDQNILSQETQFLGSVGPGLRYHFGDHLSARFDYGVQMETVTRLIENVSDHSRIHFGLTVSF